MVNYRYPESELDRNIHAILDELHSRLPCMWYIAPEQMNLFGRVYRNPKKNGNGFIPEFYRGDSEYKDTLLDDQYACVGFCGIADTVTEDVNECSAECHFVFFAHLGRLKFRDRNGKEQVMTGRGDLEARNAVQAVLGQNIHGFMLETIQTGPTALREYDIQRPQANQSELNRWDMHPWHVFRVNGTIRWDKPNLNNFDQNN